MELRQLQIFLVAAKTLNFTKAGIQLGYAQSNITGQIRQLEEELQLRLFERLGRGLRLTAEGENFLQRTQQILELCNRAKEELSPGIYGGILRIGAAETLCVSRLPQLLGAYRKLCPQVAIRIRTESCETLSELLRSNEIDVALVLTDKIDAPDMEIRVLHEEAMTLVASPTHPLAQKKRLTADDLAQECLIITTPGCGYRPLIRSVFKKQPLSAMMELSSVGAIRECAACGLGAAVLPRIAVADDILRGRVVELDWNAPLFSVKTQLLHHREKWLTPALRAFLALCSGENPD